MIEFIQCNHVYLVQTLSIPPVAYLSIHAGLHCPGLEILLQCSSAELFVVFPDILADQSELLTLYQ